MNIPETIIVEHCGNDHLEPISSICEISVPGFPKPQGGGLWTSPIDSEYNWRKWCEIENFNIGYLEKSFRMEVSTKNLLVIDSYYDFSLKMLHSNIMTIGKYSLPVIDWKKLVSQYNGIWLTARGEAETRYTHPYSLYGWDCETVLLFNSMPIINVLD